MEDHFGLVILAIFAFSVLLAVVEFLVELRRGQITRGHLREMGASFSVGLVSQLTEGAGTAITIGALSLVAQAVPWTLPITPWTALACIVVVDLSYYVEHRLEHRVRLLWTYHSVHHSSPVYNYSTAFRVAFVENFFSWIYFVPAVLLGFDPLLVLLALALMLTYQFWLHTALIGKLGAFELVFMTPSQHRVHHGSDALYLDKNYGAIFSIWDRMFGTHQEELFTPTYGLTDPIGTTNPVRVHIHEVAALLRDLVQARSWRARVGLVFGPPGSSPS